MKIIGIYLLEFVFTHSQLYVVLSQVTHVNDVFYFLPECYDDDQCCLYELLR